MGLSPHDSSDRSDPADPRSLPREPYPPFVPYTPAPPEPRTRYVVLFLLTFVTTTFAGIGWVAGGLTQGEVSLNDPQIWLRSLWYSGGVLGILGAHEFGHYFACRYYGVRASLPYFLPFPLGPGTLGAVIRIRQPIATKREFFDIGIAGPIAGFVVLVPVLVFAIGASTVVRLPENFQGVEFGEPLLFRMVASLFFGEIPANHSIDLHPAGWAAWFGMLATALNLAPIGQLDGGHISYGVFGRRSSTITIAVTVLLVGLLAVSLGYLLWTLLVVAMVLILGPHHPRTIDESEPLGRGRLLLAAFAVAMFVLCFTPVPIQFIGM